MSNFGQIARGGPLARVLDALISLLSRMILSKSILFKKMSLVVVWKITFSNGRLVFNQKPFARDDLFQVGHCWVVLRYKGQGSIVFSFFAQKSRERSWKVTTRLRYRLQRWVIGLKISRQFFNEWEAKAKPIALWTSYGWLLGISSQRGLVRHSSWCVLTSISVTMYVTRHGCWIL